MSVCRLTHRPTTQPEYSKPAAFRPGEPLALCYRWAFYDCPHCGDEHTALIGGEQYAWPKSHSRLVLCLETLGTVRLIDGQQQLFGEL